jgi:ABC-type spermidine/putrescine transport system permease subunit II
LLVLIGVFLVAPVAMLLARAFLDHAALEEWGELISNPINRNAILTSIALGATCAAISTVIGTPVAWLVSRALPRRRAAWLGLFNVAAHFGGIGLAFAYVATLGAFGMVTLALRATGLAFDPPERGSFAALVLAYEYANIPLFILLVVPGMSVLRDDWREAAHVAGASRWQFWRRIGLPVLMPFILAGTLLSFTWTIGVYGIAYGLVGESPTQPVRLLTLQIGQTLADDAVNGDSRAAVLAMVLVGMALVALGGYRWLNRRGLRWFSGRAIDVARSGPARTEPSRGSAWAEGLLRGAVILYLGLPVLAVAIYSIATRWTGNLLPDGFTLNNWLSIATDPKVRSALLTSLFLAALTTVFVVLLTVPAAYWARVVNPRIRVLLELSAAIPFALPFLVIGLALLEFSGIVAPALQGSIPLLLIAYVAVSFPVVYWAVDAAMVAAGVEKLAEAAATCGASGIQTLLRVVLPNIRSGVIAGAMLSFATVIGEFALVSVRASSVRTLSVWSASTLRDRNVGGVGPLAAVTLLTFVSLFALSWLVARTNRRRTSLASVSETTGLPELASVPEPGSA